MVTINCRIRDELTKDRFPARKHVEWQIEQPVRCLSRRLRRASVGCGCWSSGRDFFIWLPIKRLSLRSTNRWAMSLVRCCSITPSLLILVRKDCASYLRIFTSRPEEEKEHALRFIQFV